MQSLFCLVTSAFLCLFAGNPDTYLREYLLLVSSFPSQEDADDTHQCDHEPSSTITSVGIVPEKREKSEDQTEQLYRSNRSVGIYVQFTRVSEGTRAACSFEKVDSVYILSARGEQ